MTIKKLTVIAAAGAVLLAGALGISMKLTSQSAMEIEVPETPVVQEPLSGAHTLGAMENTPLYFDETEKLLLPLRNVMEGLGGTVTWNPETKMTEVVYRDRTLALKAGEEQALLNGYDVTLPAAAEVINGCLYADEMLLSAYYTGDVDFNTETRQVTLQMKDNTVPLVAMHVLKGAEEGRGYEIEAPVFIGLNDGNYEKNLNAEILKEMQSVGEAFLTEDEAEGELYLRLQTGMCTKEFISMFWEGSESDIAVRLAKNIDLLGQKTVMLGDMLAEASMDKVKAAAGQEWTEDRFYLTEEGGLMILKGSNDNSHSIQHWATDDPLDWQKGYHELIK